MKCPYCGEDCHVVKMGIPTVHRTFLFTLQVE